LPTISDAALVTLVIGVLAATVIDIRTRRIPNLLTALMAATGIGLAAVGANGVSVAAAALGIVIGFCLMLPGHALGATGAGDVKLMAAVGAIVGPILVVKAFLFTGIAGGVLAIVVAVRRRRLAATLAATGHMIGAPSEAPHVIRSAVPGSRFAYGPAIAVGSVLAVLMR
jgi:prepilin peptidase CpaA